MLFLHFGSNTVISAKKLNKALVFLHSLGSLCFWNMCTRQTKLVRH